MTNQDLLSRLRSYASSLEGKLTSAREARTAWESVASVPYIGGKSVQEKYYLADSFWRIKLYTEVLRGLYQSFPEIKSEEFPDVPIANWPNDNNSSGTLVQLYVDSEPYLRFGERPFQHPGEIIKEFLNILKVPYHTTIGQYSKKIVPELNGDRYSVAGMGNFFVDKNIVELLDLQHRDYSLGINQRHLDDIVRLQPELKFEFDSDGPSKFRLILG